MKSRSNNSRCNESRPRFIRYSGEIQQNHFRIPGRALARTERVYRQFAISEAPSHLLASQQHNASASHQSDEWDNATEAKVRATEKFVPSAAKRIDVEHEVILDH